MSETGVAATNGVSVEDVRRVYRVMLGREPESEDVLQGYLHVRDLHALYQGFIDSEEFQAKRGPQRPPAALLTPMRPIQDNLPPRPLARLLEAVSTYWQRIGEDDPHWSVLTEDRYRAPEIDANTVEFFQTGEHDLRLIRHAVGNFWGREKQPETIVEFGCGVGRVSVHLCEAFRSVVGCDVSGSHLRHAIAACEARGPGNFVAFRVTAQQIIPDVDADIWFTRLVLQHNPPPLQRLILEASLRRITPGGLAIFQIPTFIRGYGFAAGRYLAEGGGSKMEMHALPQAVVLAILRDAGFEIMLLLEDTAYTIGDPADATSHYFVARKT